MTKTILARVGVALWAGSLSVACGDSSESSDTLGSGGLGSASGGANGSGGASDGSGGSTSAAAGNGNGSGGTAAALGTLFSDDFESGSAKWQVTQGTCAVQADASNVYDCINGGNEARALAGDLSWTDYTVSAKIRLVQMDASRRVYLAGRFTDSNNWYGAAFYSDNTPAIQLRKKQGGTSSDLASSPFPFVLGQWYTVALKLSGSTLSMSVDGVTQLTITDTTFSSGRIALLVDRSEVSFDDVLVTNP